ncbi:MAG: signal peptide peptidase SppA [Bernardetiaceae bacterium]
MKSFLKAVLAVVVGLFASVVLLSVVAIFGVGLLSGPKEVKVKEKSVLRLKLDRPLVEYTSEEESPFDNLSIPTGIPFMRVASPVGLINLRETLANAKEDPNISGIYLDVNIVNGGWSQLYDLRQSLLDFKASGKFIYAFGQIITEKAYFLGSVADEVYLMPSGMFAFTGLSVEKTYYKGLFEKLGLQPKIYKVGDFKSFVEPYMLDQMSQADSLQTATYLNSIYDFYIQAIAQSRGLDPQEVRRISDQMLIETPEDALRSKLITDTLYEDQVMDKLRATLEIEADEKINFISYNKYRKAPRMVPKKFSSESKIAVIIGEGGIGSGKSEDGTIGSETIVAELRKARKDKKVKAVVLRINSPGGSALASDEMWREVQVLRKEKPVIASMSDVAASGGYYMAMGCDHILAQPNTITGSIGIFAILFDASQMLNQKLGLTFSRVNTGEFSDLGSPTRPFSAAEDARWQAMIERGYDDFTKKAAQGRNMTQDDLKKVASGRVWTGQQALQIGLVDELGDLQRAIEIAAQRAELEPDSYMVTYRPKPTSPLQDLLGSNDKTTQLTEQYLQDNLGVLAPHWNQIRMLSQMQGLQARLPYRVDVIGKTKP